MTMFLQTIDQILPFLNFRELAMLNQVSVETQKKVSQSKSLKKCLWRGDLDSSNRKHYWTGQINLIQ